MGKTLSEKLWERHLVHEAPGEHDLLYIDMHLVHEVTSPQAFDGLRMAGPAGAAARPDDRHGGPQRADDSHRSADRGSDLGDAALGARHQLRRVWRASSFRWPIPNQGIVHVIGPELGLTLPGMTIVCGDSHTSTHGAFGALAFGIGTSEVEHVLATQSLPQVRPKTMAITVDGELATGRRRPRMSSWPSSARSAPAAASATSSSTAARRFGPFRWKAG